MSYYQHQRDSVCTPGQFFKSTVQEADTTSSQRILAVKSACLAVVVLGATARVVLRRVISLTQLFQGQVHSDPNTVTQLLQGQAMVTDYSIVKVCQSLPSELNIQRHSTVPVFIYSVSIYIPNICLVI